MPDQNGKKFVGGFERLPVTAENLAMVTTVAKMREPDYTALLVESIGSGEDYKIIDLFDGFGGIKDVSDGGLKTIVKMLEGISGQGFVLVEDNISTLHFRRRDCHEAIRNLTEEESKELWGPPSSD